MEKPWIGERARISPEDPAIFHGGETVSFRQLHDRSLMRAEQLKLLGVEAGDIIASLLENGLSAVELFHVAQLSGVALLPLNIRLTATEIAFQLDEIRPKVLLVEGERLVSLTSAVCRTLTDPPILVTDPLEYRAVPLPVTTEGSVTELPWTILYTSGTTGRPKGVVLTSRHFGSSALAGLSHLGSKKNDRWLACVPLFHIAGLSILTKSVLSGAGVVLHSRFDTEDVSAALDTQHITLLSLVPTMLHRLVKVRLAAGKRAVPSLRAVLIGGASCSEELRRQSLDLGFPVLRTYGLTETCSQVATEPLTETLTDSSSLPKPLRGVELKIVNNRGESRAAWEEGEILVRGGMVMNHYFNRVAESEKALQDGWLHTGDIGFLDDHGGLCLLSRRNDLIVSGGENVYPAEVEACLIRHPAVEEVCVTGEDDEEFGQCVVAWVAPRDLQGVSEEGLRQHCRKSLAGYKVPRRIITLKRLPRNALGKILRQHLSLYRL